MAAHAATNGLSSDYRIRRIVVTGVYDGAGTRFGGAQLAKLFRNDRAFRRRDDARSVGLPAEAELTALAIVSKIKKFD